MRRLLLTLVPVLLLAAPLRADDQIPVAVLTEIKASFKNVVSVVIADYRGITVPVVTRMRDDFRKAGCHYRVVKNSLVKIAVKGSRMEPLSQIIEWLGISKQAAGQLVDTLVTRRYLDDLSPYLVAAHA